MKRKMDVLIRCPYYKGEERSVLYCEGVQEGCCLHLAFGALPDLKDYKKAYCKGCWKGCRIADMLNRKWDYQP